MNWLFPHDKRVIPGKRWLSIISRTLHLIGISGLAGAYLYGLPETQWYPYLILTVVTGVLMTAMEIYGDGIWLLQLRGTAILLKIFLIATMLWWWHEPVALVYTLLIVISGIVSHAPGKVRYYSIWHRRVILDSAALRSGAAVDNVKDCGG